MKYLIFRRDNANRRQYYQSFYLGKGCGGQKNTAKSFEKTVAEQVVRHLNVLDNRGWEMIEDDR